jgi:hypothetical protein
MLENEIAVDSGFVKRVYGFDIQPWSTTKLIGLAGPARSGKDTVAGMLKDAYEAKSVAFADPLRAGLGAMFGFGPEHFNGPLKEVPVEPYGKSYRYMAQTLGTEWGRKLIHEDLWVLIAYEKIKKIHAAGCHAVVTDVRFDNEAEFVRSKGGVVWHIYRPDAPKVNTHASEAGVTFVEGDMTIANNGTLDHLMDEVCDAFERM